MMRKSASFLTFLALFPFYIAGIAAGSIYNAFRSGLRDAADVVDEITSWAVGGES